MTASKNIAICGQPAEGVYYWRALAAASCDKTNVNCTCDITDLDQIGPISVQEV